ncbi:MAG: 50S ribosomal protein L34e [Nitrososphaerota archaeon]
MRRSLRTRARKRVKSRTPGGRSVLHFRSEVPGKPTCQRCGGQLHGIPRRLDGGHTVRTVSRPGGGLLCSRCVRILIRENVKALAEGV